MSSLHHIGLTVGDLERSVDFYRGLLGCEVIDKVESHGSEMAVITGVEGVRLRAADLRLPGGETLELIQYLYPVEKPLAQHCYEAGHTHIGFRVDDAHAAHARLLEIGGVARSAPVQLSSPGSVWDAAWVFYALDPDGRTIELVQLG
jgi:glyoxylase I family protein